MVRVVAGGAVAVRVSVAVVPSAMVVGVSLIASVGASFCAMVAVMVVRLGLLLICMVSAAVVCAAAVMR